MTVERSLRMIAGGFVVSDDDDSAQGWRPRLKAGAGLS
jgi:hypothetical protein